MSVLQNTIKRLRAIDVTMKKAIRKELIKEQRFIADLNRKQLRSGIRSDGTDMPNYVPNSKSPSAPGKIKLFDKGDFHGGIAPLFDDVGFELIGEDSKTNLLSGKYGEAILGLTPDNLQAVREKLLVNLQARKDLL